MLVLPIIGYGRFLVGTYITWRHNKDSKQNLIRRFLGANRNALIAAL